MTSRDRLSGGDFPEAIEEEMEKLVKEHPELRALRERRRREDVEALTAEDKPLEELLEQLLARSPGLSRLLLSGGQISDPFKHVKVRGTRAYKGRRFPTYFRFEGEDYGNVLRRGCHIKQRFRVTFETDAENEYFSREVARGDFAFEHEKKGSRVKAEDYVLNLVNGIATLTVDLPKDCAVGEQLSYICEVTDSSRPDPFINRFTLTVGQEIKSRSVSRSGSRQAPQKETKEKRLLTLPFLRLFGSRKRIGRHSSLPSTETLR